MSGEVDIAQRLTELEARMTKQLAEAREAVRSARWHDVFCLVLKEEFAVYFSEQKVAWSEDNASMVKRAKNIADLSYPPSKEQP